MREPYRTSLILAWLAGPYLLVGATFAQTETLTHRDAQATITVIAHQPHRQYKLTTTADLRDNDPMHKQIIFTEATGQATARTNSTLFDGLYALAVHEALENSVDQIQDGGYNHGQPIALQAFQTGAKWPYVWTRDLAYSVDLALAQFDPQRAADSLLFKTSYAKRGVALASQPQIVQDTGSGGSYPVSTDRVVWALGAAKLLHHLPSDHQLRYAQRFYPILRGTIAQDRQLVFDPQEGLYRGEQSFLDWREQSYPAWTRDNVLAIGMSKALSTNVGHYILLKTAAELAERLGHHAEQKRYAQWASDLKTAINARFYDENAGLYAAYRLSDVAWSIPVQRYELLGQSLAILAGVADEHQRTAIIANYPSGPHGPPVVWPQDPGVPIYHNHATWPFVTAYWTKAAKAARNAFAVEHGVHSLMRTAALNLSNMENLDYVTGQAWARVGALEGPVINSQRQLWSVAGYLAMVQGVLFGMETNWDGIRFRPFIPWALRNDIFKSSNTLELLNLRYRDKHLDIRIHLPPAESQQTGACAIERVTLNGQPIGDAFIKADQLASDNVFEIHLAPHSRPANHALRVIDAFEDPQAHFGPATPEWKAVGQNGISSDGRRLTLHYTCLDSEVRFTIYRNGRRYATNVRETSWTDPNSLDFREQTYGYAVAAEYISSGHVSHLSPTRYYVTNKNRLVIPAQTMTHTGGDLVNGHHWQNWGQPNHTLTASSCRVQRDGTYLLRVRYANGSSPVNTGITCAVKRIEVRDGETAVLITAGYVIMPQSGDWRRFDLSSPLIVTLLSDRPYTIHLSTDGYAHNMSVLEHNRLYTAHAGGGEDSYNYVNVAGLELIRMAGSDAHVE